MTKAPIADIKRMTVHDGPGIRSTVFVKGCPLNCLWCHNPESISAVPQMLYHENLCIHCGNCNTICPAHAINHGVIDRAQCRGCALCEQACFRNALTFCGKKMTAQEVFRSVMRDQCYYGRDDGGVTLSGGEPLLYPEFAAELFAMLRKEQIHTALDTCGHVPFRHFEMVLPWTSLVLYDLKGMDPARHQKNTGQSNRLILENLQELGRRNIPLEIRMPLIPAHNDSPAELRATAEFLKGIPSLTRIKLLPFHNMARNKYKAAGLPDTTPDVIPPDHAFMEKAAAYFTFCPVDL